MKKLMKKNAFMIVLLLVVFVIVAAGSSFAFFTFYKEGSAEHVLRTKGLNIVFDDTNSISIDNDNAYPIPDSIGRNNDPYSFTMTTDNDFSINYQISIINDDAMIKSDGCADNLLDYSNLKIQLKKNGTVISEGLLSNFTDSIIDSGSIAGSQINYYELRIWIDKDSSNEIMGKHLHSKVQLKVTD